MRLATFNIDEFCKDLPEVTFSKILEKRRFSKDGLFSQQIFGPIKSYTCACNKLAYKGKNYEHDKCPVCGVPITSSESRKKTYAKIVLPFPVLNPLFYYILCGKGSTVKKVLDNLLNYKEEYWFNESGDLEKFDVDEARDLTVEYFKGLDGAKKYIEIFLTKHIDSAEKKDKEPKKEYVYLMNNMDKITIKNIVVMPPEFRPCGKLKSGDYVSDDVNKLFQEILKVCNGIKNIQYTLTPDQVVYQVNFSYLQKMIINLYDYILNRMSKKTGLIRANILGKRVDFSGRAVITPDATLKLNECRLPYWMVLEMMKPQLITHFINRRICKRSNRAITLIDECIQNKDTKYFDIVREFCKGKVCVLNRQPTLHRLSVLAFYIDIHLGNTIQIHPLVCAPYNADFDGDAMACYVGITNDSIEDIKNHVGIWNNLISPTDMSSVAKPNQDVILGVYAATRE